MSRTFVRDEELDVQASAWNMQRVFALHVQYLDAGGLDHVVAFEMLSDHAINGPERAYQTVSRNVGTYGCPRLRRRLHRLGRRCGRLPHTVREATPRIPSQH